MSVSSAGILEKGDIKIPLFILLTFDFGVILYSYRGYLDLFAVQPVVESGDADWNGGQFVNCGKIGMTINLYGGEVTDFLFFDVHLFDEIKFLIFDE